jgi:poly(3-hydroxybutyrate) depolymerase
MQCARVPKLREYWLQSDAILELATADTRTTDDAVRTGFMHHKPAATRAAYSTYVPESYDPKQTWPLVIALHGSHGSGAEHLLTWLRPAKRHGYIVLSPKSLDSTWSIEQPSDDIRSILVMLTEVAEAYNVDTDRVFVSGLSDGRTFSYALGLHCPSLFAGIAPVAAALPPRYPLDRAKNLPVLLVHGAQDSIFPVATARAANARFKGKQFRDVGYIELPQWGHAYTYSINECHLIP